MARFCSQRVCGSLRVVWPVKLELLAAAFASANRVSAAPVLPPIATIAEQRGGNGRSTNPYRWSASSDTSPASHSSSTSVSCGDGGVMRRDLSRKELGVSDQWVRTGGLPGIYGFTCAARLGCRAWSKHFKILWWGIRTGRDLVHSTE